MPHGRRSKPIITIQNVEAALNSLIYSSVDTSAAATLRSLALVQEYLQHPARPRAGDLREFAVKALICGIITERLNQFRHVAGLPLLEIASTISVASEEIAAESRTNNPDFIGWSYLYYRYVRVDLGLSLSDFERFSSLESRTLRRYRHHAIQNLVEELITREWQIREIKHHRRLQAAIPKLPIDTLPGRADVIEQIILALQRDLASTIYITGPAGVGKTALVQLITRHLIEKQDYDYVFWVDGPTSYDQIYNHLRTELLPHYTETDLPELFMAWKCLVILDACDVAAAELHAVMRLLAHTTTFVTTTSHYPLPHIVHHIHLQDLPLSVVPDMLQQNFPQVALNSEQIHQIGKRIGGNPAAWNIYMNQWIEGIDDTLSIQTLQDLYASTYEHLEPGVKRVWHLFALIGVRGSEPHTIEQLISLNIIKWEDFQKLQNRFLLQPNSDSATRYALSNSAIAFIATRYQQRTSIREDIDILVHHFARQLAESYSHQFGEMAVQIMCCPWLRIDMGEICIILEKFILGSVRHGEAAWWKVYQAHHNLPFGLRAKLAFGIAGRKRHEYIQAERLFQEVIKNAGKQGFFDVQAQAMFEYAVLLRLQGDYQQAQTHLQHLTNYQHIGILSSTNDDINHELAQILIEQGNGKKAQEHLLMIEQQESAPWTQQMVECLALQGRIKDASDHAQAALKTFEEKLTEVEKIAFFTTLGRLSSLKQMYDEAINWFTAALHLSEQLDHQMLIGRSKANLGGTLVAQGEKLELAQSLLEEALHIQRFVEDPLGKAVIGKNLRILQAKQITGK